MFVNVFPGLSYRPEHLLICLSTNVYLGGEKDVRYTSKHCPSGKDPEEENSRTLAPEGRVQPHANLRGGISLMEVSDLTKEKKKIDARKIIYRKLRESVNTKKVAKMTTLAVLFVALAMLIPGLCTGTEIPGAFDTSATDIQEREPDFDSMNSESSESAEESNTWPPKALPEPTGISGQTTQTYHI